MPIEAGDPAKSTDHVPVGKTPIVGTLDLVLGARATGRRLRLIPTPFRAVIRDEIHEVLATPEPAAGPGQTVNEVAGIGFFAVDEGGILQVGDRMKVGEREIGEVAGFDLTHFPNHVNIVVRASTLATGLDLGLQPGNPVSFAGASS